MCVTCFNSKIIHIVFLTPNLCDPFLILGIKVKVRFALEEVMKAQSVSRGTDLLFL